MTPVALLETADGKKLYVVNQGDGTVSVIDTVARTVSKTINLGHSSPVRAAISPEGAALFVLNQGDSTVSVISTTDDTIQGNALPVGATPTFIEFDRRLKRFYVTNGGDNTVSVYKADVTPPVLLATIPVGIAPVSITALSDGSRAYVANSGCTDVVALQGCSANTVSVIDLTSLRVSKTITVGNTPLWVESAPDGSKVFVANRDSNTISDIRTLDDTVVVTLPAAAPAPVFIAVTP
jgi:YVTN family beta-propeller protein